MLEPITLSLVAQSLATSQLISSVIGGWLGNRSDHYLCKAGQVVYEHLKNQTEPVNHDIQRAVREAYLRATLMACERLLYQKYNWIDRRFHLPTYDLKEIIGYLKKQRRQLDKAKFIKPTNPADADYLLLLEPPSGRPATERVNELKQQLRDGLLRELERANLYVEDDLKAAILTGWTDEGKTVDWYELMCAFFAEILKTNSRLSTIVQTNLLRDLKVQVPEIQWPNELLEQQAALIGEAVQPLVKRFDEVMSRLDNMLELLGEVRDGVVQANEKLDTLLGRPASPARAKYLNTFARYDLQNLIGREKQLLDIDVHLAKHNLLLLRGMGGIGKTTLARAYLARMEAQFDHVAFVEITTTIADGMLLTLGGSNDIDFTPDPAKDAEAKFSDLLEVLRHIPNTLLVIDNANDNEDLLHRKKAFDSLPWKVLITSRARVPTYQQEHKMQEIKHLLPDEALALFEKLYNQLLNNTETEMVKAILEKAFYHPKLIEVLAKAARENPLLELTTLQDIVENKDYDDDEINYPVEVGDEEKPVYRILLDLFDTDQLSEEGQHLLRYFSVLPTIDIPFKHLTELLNAEDANARKSLLENLKKLTRTGWLDDLDNRYFSMHGLVQWVVRERLKPTAENCEVLIGGMRLILYCEPTENPLNKQIYLPYTADWFLFFGDGQNEEVAGAYDNIATIHGALGENETALLYDQKALTIRENLRPINYTKLAKSYHNIAITYGALGDHNKRLLYNQKALTIWKDLLPDSTINIAQSYNGIAVTYGDLGDYSKQLIYNQKALAIRETVLPANDSNLAQSFGNLAITYGNLGDYKNQLLYNQKSLAIWEIVLSADHPNLALSYNNIALTYYKLNELEKALEYMQKAVAIRENILLPTHADLIGSKNDLAMIEQALRERNEKPG